MQPEQSSKPAKDTKVLHPEQSSGQPTRDMDLAASQPRLSNDQGLAQGEPRLTDDELAALPVLVSALREWLDAQAGHIPYIGDQEDAQVRTLSLHNMCLKACNGFRKH